MLFFLAQPHIIISSNPEGSLKESSHFLKGAGIGATVGAFTGGCYGLFLSNSETPYRTATTYSIFGSLSFSFIGGLIGKCFTKQETKKKQNPLTPQTHPSEGHLPSQTVSPPTASAPTSPPHNHTTQQQATASDFVTNSKLQFLHQQYFLNDTKNRAALQQAQGDVNQAAIFLSPKEN